MEVDSSTQPGLEPVRHPATGNAPKPENSAYGSYGTGMPPYGASPQNSYNSPQHSYGSPNGYGTGAPEAYTPLPVQGKNSGRRTCGMATATLVLIIALIVCLIAAAVGGGVGGTIAVNNAKKQCLSDAAVTLSSLSAVIASATRVTSSSKSTSSSAATSSSSKATPTATQPWGAVGTDIGLTGCPSSDGTIYTSTFGPAKYKIFCNKDQPGNDLMQTLVTTMGLCMEACSSWNLSPSVSVRCAGIAYIPSYIDGNGGQPTDCYLKSVANETALAANTYVVDFGVIQ